MKQCPNCGAQIADDSRFCAECGKEIPQGTVCPYCGASISEGDAFCQNCGKKLTDIEGTTYESEVVKKSGFKKYLPYIIGAFVALAVIGYFNSKDSNDSAPNDKEIQATDSVAEIVETETSDSGTEEDIKNALESMYKEILNPSKTVYDNDAKYTSSEYQSILNKAYDVAVDEVVLDADHWIQGQDCDKPSMSVVSVKKESDTKAIAEIKIKQFYNEAYQSRVRLALLFENGKWVVDDFVSYGDGGEEYSEKAYLKKYIEESQSQAREEENLSNDPNSKYFGRWSHYIVSEGQRVKVYTAIINSDMTARWILYLPDGSVNSDMPFRQCVFKDGMAYFTDNGDTTIKMTPRFRLGANGLQTADGIDLKKE